MHILTSILYFDIHLCDTVPSILSPCPTKSQTPFPHLPLSSMKVFISLTFFCKLFLIFIKKENVCLLFITLKSILYLLIAKSLIYRSCNLATCKSQKKIPENVNRLKVCSCDVRLDSTQETRTTIINRSEADRFAILM